MLCHSVTVTDVLSTESFSGKQGPDQPFDKSIQVSGETQETCRQWLTVQFDQIMFDRDRHSCLWSSGRWSLIFPISGQIWWKRSLIIYRSAEKEFELPAKVWLDKLGRKIKGSMCCLKGEKQSCDLKPMIQRTPAWDYVAYEPHPRLGLPNSDHSLSLSFSLLFYHIGKVV